MYVVWATAKLLLRIEKRKGLVFNTEFKKKNNSSIIYELTEQFFLSDFFIDHFFAFLNNIHVKICEGFRRDHLKVIGRAVSCAKSFLKRSAGENVKNDNCKSVST